MIRWWYSFVMQVAGALFLFFSSDSENEDYVVFKTSSGSATVATTIILAFSNTLAYRPKRNNYP